MKIVVINLASDAARWRAVERQLRRLGLEPTRQDAVAGADLRLGQVAGLYCAQLNRRQYHKPLRSGEIGCYASHIVAWRGLLQSNESALAVFEDDVEVQADLPRVLDALAAAPANWDVVKLIGRAQEKVADHAPLLPGRELVSYRRVPSLTSAYVLSRQGAAKLLAARLPFGRPVDVDMRHWWECGLRIAGVQPYPVARGPASWRSTIEDRRFRADGAMRLHRLWLQARYTVLNWRAQTLGATPAPMPVEPRRSHRAVADAPVRHDPA